jgi:nucleoid DNA-binding protein
MNKGDLINEVAKLVSTKKQAQEVVDCVFSAVTEHPEKK